MASCVGREEAVNTPCGMDISDTEPLSTEVKIPSTGSPCLQGHVISPAATESDRGCAFLALPTEVRIQIYDLLLVSRSRHKDSSLAINNTFQRMILLERVGDPWPGSAKTARTLELAILRTCKQIYREAIEILYSQNVFKISSPEQAVGLISRFGPANTASIRSLRLWVRQSAELAPWLRLFSVLAKEATGLREIDILWAADWGFVWAQGMRQARGLGDNLLFVRALARIHGLGKLTISGYYANRWPAYLEEKMGVSVRAYHGIPMRVYHPDGTMSKLQVVEEFRRRFVSYQEGTEDLIP